MSPRDKVNAWLRELTPSGSSLFALDEHGLCLLADEQETVLAIQIPKNSTEVYLHSKIAPPPQENSGDLLSDLLKANYLCLETRGTTLAMDQDGNIVLCYTVPVEGLDFTGFGNLLGEFLETRDHWVQRLSQPPSGKRDKPTNTEVLISATDIRV